MDLSFAMCHCFLFGQRWHRSETSNPASSNHVHNAKMQTFECEAIVQIHHEKSTSLVKMSMGCLEQLVCTVRRNNYPAKVMWTAFVIGVDGYPIITASPKLKFLSNSSQGTNGSLRVPHCFISAERFACSKPFPNNPLPLRLEQRRFSS
jgi:hypothetical protein